MLEDSNDTWRGTVQVGDCLNGVAMDGPYDAPRLMLSNSLGSDLSMWDRQLAAFAEHFRVIRYDSRGHGKSDAPQGPYTMERLGRDAVTVLDHLGIEKTNWCGLSMGGTIGQWLGANAPSRLDKIVLSNTTAYYADKRSWTNRIEFVQTNGVKAMAAPSMERWFSADFRERDPAAVVRATEMLIATDPKGYAGCCAAVRDMDHRTMLSKIDAPTLVIAGRLDAATPIEAHEFIRNRIPRARMAILEAAHLSNVEQPDSYTDIVLQFLRT
jgi:3-oxoadipate enol-lactonase